MKRNDIIKLLVPGFVVGFVLGLIVIALVGVDKKNEISNIIGGVFSSIIPTLLNGIVVLKGASKTLKRKLSVLGAFKINLIYILVAAVIGFLFTYVVLISILEIDLRSFTRLENTLVFASFGAIISTVLAYFALKSYERKVKYTRREK